MVSGLIPHTSHVRECDPPSMLFLLSAWTWISLLASLMRVRWWSKPWTCRDRISYGLDLSSWTRPLGLRSCQLTSGLRSAWTSTLWSGPTKLKAGVSIKNSSKYKRIKDDKAAFFVFLIPGRYIVFSHYAASWRTTVSNFLVFQRIRFPFQMDLSSKPHILPHLHHHYPSWHLWNRRLIKQVLDSSVCVVHSTA